MARCFIGLGSNMGDSMDILDNALASIKQHPQIGYVRCSSYYQTAPVGYLEQDDFINAVATFETSLQPLELLSFLEQIEQEHHRVRTIKNGPRTLDLDLLVYEGEMMKTKRLTLPHPRMCERAFVLIPFNELNKDYIIAPFNRSVNSFLASLSTKERNGVKKCRKSN